MLPLQLSWLVSHLNTIGESLHLALAVQLMRWLERPP